MAMSGAYSRRDGAGSTQPSTERNQYRSSTSMSQNRSAAARRSGASTQMRSTPSEYRESPNIENESMYFFGVYLC